MTQMDTKEHSVLQRIHRHQPITRQELREQLGWGQRQVSASVAALLHEQWICEEVCADGTPGRPAATLLVNPIPGRVVGLDIGSQHMHGVVTDMRGQVLASATLPTKVVPDRVEILNQISRLVATVCQKESIDPPKLAALGIGMRGLVNPSTGRALGWHSTPEWTAAWTGLDLPQEFSARLGVSCVLAEDSVRAMGVIAHRSGPAKGVSHFLYVLLSHGVGSALIVNGRPYAGGLGLAGHLGHVTVVEDGEWCSCGNRGCLQTVISTGRVIQRVRDRLEAAQADSILYPSLRDELLTLPRILEAAKAGDKIAFQVLDEAGMLTGRVISIALNLLAPERVVLGGPLTDDNGIILNAVERQVRLHAMRQISSETEIVYDQYEEYAGARGMALLALDELFGSQVHVEKIAANKQEPAPPASVPEQVQTDIKTV
jgi:predicted NBD/HSP70 family sugar kinase